MIVRILTGLGFAALGLCCIAPLAVRAKFNIGSGTGLCISVIMILYMIFFPKVNEMIAGMWRTRAGRLFLCVAGAAAAAVLITVIVITGQMIHAAKNTPDGSETVVVLGCRVYERGPGRLLVRRLEAAYEYLKENPDAKCIVSGGQGSDEPEAEAECMYKWLVAEGIDGKRIFKEDKSSSTLENLQFSKALAEREGLNTDMAVVTSEFHCYRAFMIGRSLGISTACIPAKTPGWMLPSYYLRELYGVVYQWIS